jgi:hypothetical protein
MKRKTCIAVAVVASLLLLALGYALTVRQISHVGVIVASDNFQLYEDEACTIPLNAWDWGTFGRNTVVHKDCFIKSLAEIQINVKWNITSGSVPSGISLQMVFNSFTWDMNTVKTLPVGAVYGIQCDLLVSESASFGDFAFTQTFSGSG